MKIVRTRAARRAAQTRYNVSPVTRAIRSVLTVSAAALAFSGTGLAFAKTPAAPSALAAHRAPLALQGTSQIPSTVVDLTRVHDASLPASVVDGELGLHAALASVDNRYAGPTGPGDGGRVDNVVDLTAVPMLAPGPGDGTGGGGTNDVFLHYSAPGSNIGMWLSGATAASATSADGYAVGAFATADGMRLLSEWNIDAAGYTWAAGIEVEALNGNGEVYNFGSVNAVVYGDTGTAVGLYAYGSVDAGAHNQATLSATSAGQDGRAVGLFAYAATGDAEAANNGTLNVTANGTGTAVGVVAHAEIGYASVYNTGTAFVDGHEATGMFASVDGAGTAFGLNSGSLTVSGVAGAYGVLALSAGGDANVDNTGAITTSGQNFGIGIAANGADANVVNDGTIVASGTNLGIGVFAIGDTADVFNTGLVSADSAYGTAYGVYAAGTGSTTVGNTGTIGATSFAGDAIGVFAYGGASVGVTNTGTITADGDGLSAGIYAIGGTIDVYINYGSIQATARGAYGEAFGVIADGTDVSVTSTFTGDIRVDGHDATGIDATGTGNVVVDHGGDIVADGVLATGIGARSTGDGQHVFVVNDGGVSVTGDVSATGIEVVSRAYLGTASVFNGGTVDVQGAYADVQGIVVSADMDAGAYNLGRVSVDGGSSAYGVLVLSADGNADVGNRGTVSAYANGRDSVAYGVAVQTNNGVASIGNAGTVYAVAETATGLYAATMWNDTQIDNSGNVLVAGFADAATGAMGLSYTGDATIANGGTMRVYGGYSSVGAFSISVYGDAHVTNTGTIETVAGAIDRGVFARALDGGDANVDNSGTISTTSAYSSYGVWSRADGGQSHVVNSGAISADSRYGVAYGVVAGGATGVDVTVADTGSIHAFGYGSSGGVLAYSNGGDARVDTAGTIDVGTYGNAFGVQALAYGVASVANTGNVHVYSTGSSAYGIAASGEDAHVVNDGDVATYGYGAAFGLEAIAYRDASITNNGNVYAQAGFGPAFGAYVGAGNNAHLANAGDLHAVAVNGDVAFGAFVYADGGVASFDNSGSITAEALNGAAFGLFVEGTSVTGGSTGTITATGDALAIGIRAAGWDSVDIANDGDIVATSNTGVATGIDAFSDGGVDLRNGGGITAHVDSGTAIGMYASAYDTAALTNCDCATIDVSAVDGTVFGMFGSGTDVVMTNSGAIDAHVDSGEAFGLFGGSYAGTTITNGATGAIAVSSGNGEATGIYARGYTVAVVNDGSIDAIGAQAVGIRAIGDGDGATVTVDNAGTIYAEGAHKYGMAAGIVADSYGDVAVANSGTVTVVSGIVNYGITASSEGGDVAIVNSGDIGASAFAASIGIRANADEGSVTVDNTGTIHVGGGKYAAGIDAYSYDGDVTVNHDGTITADAFDRALGLFAGSYSGDASVAGTGDVHVTSGSGNANGIVVESLFGHALLGSAGLVEVSSVYGNAMGLLASGDVADATNDGTVTVTGGGFAVGIGIDGETAGSAVNNGTITVVQTGAYTGYAPALDVEPGNAVGIAGYVADGNLAITNHGSLDVTAYDNATGIQAFAYGNVTVDSDGTISAIAQYGDATGIEAIAASSYGATSAIVTNGGAITVRSDEYAAQGIRAVGTTVDVQNAGDIDVTGAVWANGIDAVGDTVTIGNSGTIHASVTGVDADVGGIFGYGAASVAIDNAGDVAVQAIGGTAYGILAYSYTGTVSIANSGSVDATGVLHAVGIEAHSDGDIVIDNHGDVIAYAGEDAIGTLAVGYAITLANAGGITAHATADDGIAYAVGAMGHDVAFGNGGDIAAIADGADAMAFGGMLRAYGTLDVENHGDVLATSTGHHGQAIGLLAMGGDALSFDNAGTIHATSSDGAAIGALTATKYGDAAIVNSGTISATAAGGETIGLVVSAHGNATLDNSGTIEATNGYLATALGLFGDGTTTVHNTGTIVAHSHLEGSIAIEGGDHLQDITNAGDIIGAMVLGGGDDVVTNAAGGTWIVLGSGTDFGSGDDHLVNAAGGTIVLHDATISLGGSAGIGNAFDNAGTLRVDGASSIDMGTGPDIVTLAPSGAPIAVLNGVPFTNDGTISFLDGAPDDTLTITGDFAGQGAIDIDVSLLNGLADVLYIDGNIVDGTVQSLNVNILDMGAGAQQIAVPVVVVAGESEAGQVVPGTITLNDVRFSASNFLDLRVALTQRLDASNATADLFELTLGFAGINDTGALAASIAPGAHSLMGAQVGTFRQRMGTFTQLGDSGKGAWVRVFRDKGTIDPSSAMDNLPQGGNFAFDQTNTGIEAGFSAHVADGFHIGASLATAKGKQTLVDGVGSDELRGDTIGGYLTYVSPEGFYADVSYRWMHFDAELLSAGGRREVGGDASAFNVEAGWNVWTSADGLKIVPQVQWTLSTVENIDRIEGALADFVSEGGDSSRARVGVEFQQTFKTASGATWTPYGVVSAVREFDGESRFTIADTFTGRTSTEGTSGMVEVGANVNVGRLDVFGGLNWTDGGALDSVLGGQVGVRYSW